MPECPPRSGWLEEKYLGWNRTPAGTDVITENVRNGDIAATLPETLPITCNLLPAADRYCGRRASSSAPTDAAPLTHVHDGRKYLFCSEPCRWIFTQRPGTVRRASVPDRPRAVREISPPDLGTVLEYWASPEEQGRDADDYAWAKVTGGHNHGTVFPG